MGERNEEVFAEIRAELDRRPGLSPGVLYQLAVHIDPAVATLQPRQFSLLYVQPARRQLTREAVRDSGRRSGPKRVRPAPAKRSAEPGARPRVAAPTDLAAPSAAAVHTAAAAATRPPSEPDAGRTRPTSGEPEARPASVPRPPPVAPERVREALLAFVHDIAAAERRADLVCVLSRVDDYIERIGMPA